MKDKFILDACCGPRMMWFNKNHPNALYVDIRKETFIASRGKKIKINPDIIADFRKLPFDDKSFKLIVWDPPHMRTLSTNFDLVKKYGGLHPETWQDDFKKGFNELWRCLEDYGVLIFKFNDISISFEKVLKQFPVSPLFGSKGYETKKNKKGTETRWFTFMKIPNQNDHPTKP